MTSIKGIVGTACLCLTFFASSNVFAAQRGQKSSEAMLQEEMALIVKECKLTDDQQKALKEKYQAKQDAYAAWDKANAEKMKAAQDASAAARKGADADAKKKSGAELKALQTERETAAADASKAIMGVLTDDQKSVWEGVKLFDTTIKRYKKSAPSEAQTAKIKSACAVAAKELGALSADDKKGKKGRQDVEKCLKWAIDNVILEVPPAPAPAQTPAVAPPAAPVAPTVPAAPAEAAPVVK